MEKRHQEVERPVKVRRMLSWASRELRWGGQRKRKVCLCRRKNWLDVVRDWLCGWRKGRAQDNGLASGLGIHLVVQNSV